MSVKQGRGTTPVTTYQISADDLRGLVDAGVLPEVTATR